HDLLEVLLLLFITPLELAQLLLLTAPSAFFLRRLLPLRLAVLEIDHPLVPEVANDMRRDLELLDDLAQLAPVVEQIEDARGEAALRKRRPRRRGGRHARR